nr:hypothetical protein GCM10017611_72280 [Rhodococcus wratislaviensis]
MDKIPSVQKKLAALVSGVRSAVLAAEYTAEPDSAGMWLPGRQALYGSMGLQSEIYPRVIAILRDLVGGGVLQLPSSVKDLTSPLMSRDIEHYVQPPGVPSEERVILFKLAWDIIDSEFAGRHQQYEMPRWDRPVQVVEAVDQQRDGRHTDRRPPKVVDHARRHRGRLRRRRVTPRPVPGT